MKVLPAIFTAGIDTAECHGGNEYRGHGSWTRPRITKKLSRPPENKPFDLVYIPDKGWQSSLDDDECYQWKKSSYDWHKKSSKRSKAAALQTRFGSLSLCVTPSSEASVLFPPGSNKGSRSTPCVPDLTPSNLHSVIINASQARSGRVQHGERPDHHGKDLQKEMIGNSCVDSADYALQDRPKGCAAKEMRTTTSIARYTKQNERLNNGSSALLPPRQAQGGSSAPEDFGNANALQNPNSSTKIHVVDDSYNAVMLDTRTALRALVRKQAQLRKAMRRLYLEANHGNRGRLSGGVVGIHQNSMALTGVRGRFCSVNLKGPSLAKCRGRRRGSPLQPLLFTTEHALQEFELSQMRLEDASAGHLLRWEKTRLRKVDYETYCTYTERYGPLSEEEFGQTPRSPGRVYHIKAFNAAREAQVWWWTVWPPVLRRRKAAALTIQTKFRGFLQRRRWCAIIRLRTLWGKNRVIEGHLRNWRDTILRTKRVRDFTRRLCNRYKAHFFTVFIALSRQQHAAREEVLWRRMQQLKLGMQSRLFEAWAKYAKTSLAVTRMCLRRGIRPAFTVWLSLTSSNRSYRRLRWACTLLASRLLRWQDNRKFRWLKSACVSVQRMARVQTARERVRRRVYDRRVRQAREVVRSKEDERIFNLLGVEQKWGDRSRAIVYQDTLHQQDVSTFLRTTAGPLEVASVLAGMMREKGERKYLEVYSDGFSSKKNNAAGRTVTATTDVTEVEAEHEVARRFVRRDQIEMKHDFEDIHPPSPLRHPRPNCGVTFVQRTHYVCHDAVVHPMESPEIRDLAAVLSDPTGITMFAEYVHIEDTPIGAVNDKKNAGNLFDLFRTIQEWRKVPSSSHRYEELTQSVLVKSKPWVSNWGEDCTYVSSSDLKKREDENPIEPTAAKQNLPKLLIGSAVVSAEESHECTAKTRAIEDASWKVLIDMHRSIWRGFLGSKQYDNYLDAKARLEKEAVEMATAEIVKRERAVWSVEGRLLRQVAARRRQDAKAKSIAEEATECILGRATTSAAGKGFLGSLVDDQVTMLAVIIIAERKALARVISTMWNNAVDEATHLITREQQEVDLKITGAPSNTARVLRRTRVADALIDQAGFSLTGTDGVGIPEEAGTDEENSGTYSGENQSLPPERTMVLSPSSGISDAKAMMAVVVIQSAVRRELAFRKTRYLVARNFIKLYDPQSRYFFWHNQSTGESTWEKPAIIDAFFKKKNVARNGIVSVGGQKESR